MATKKKSTVEEILGRSGNSFHSRVVKKLRDEGWTVLVSPHYSDNFTDKPREIDIIAEKKFDVKDHTQWVGSLNVHLFIECKYINSDTVFWFDAKDPERAIERAMRDTGLEHPRQNTNIQKHHYLKDVPVAKLFASDSKKSEDNETINKAINQDLNATVYYRNRGDLKLITTERGYIERILKRLSYPLIVVNSFEHFYATDMDESGETKPITEPFQLEVNYAYTDKDRNSHNEYFLIDVVSIDALPDFLNSAIASDASIVTDNVAWNERRNRTEQSRRNTRGEDYI